MKKLSGRVFIYTLYLTVSIWTRNCTWPVGWRV